MYIPRAGVQKPVHHIGEFFSGGIVDICFQTEDFFFLIPGNGAYREPYMPVSLLRFRSAESGNVPEAKNP